MRSRRQRRHLGGLGRLPEWLIGLLLAIVVVAVGLWLLGLIGAGDDPSFDSGHVGASQDLIVAVIVSR